MPITRTHGALRVAAAALAVFAAVAPPASAQRERVSEAAVRAHMEMLASDALQGRGSGTRDEWIAATYVASQLRRAGVQPLDGATDFIHEIETDRVEPAAPTLSPAPDDPTVKSDAATRPGRTWNVLGQISGRDRTRARDVILLSAHLDHVGVRGTGDDTIYNGADDDASGVTAVLELARAFGEGRRPPRRTIVFAFFGSEEAGGHGSRAFIAQPPVPLDRIVANLQFEMIGRPDPAVPPRTVWLTGYERSTLGPELAQRGARLVADPHPDENFFFRSDNIRFAYRGVIAHTVSSFGLHREYHTPADDLSYIDYAHMTAAIRSMLDAIEWLANASFVPEWRQGGRPEPRQR